MTAGFIVADGKTGGHRKCERIEIKRHSPPCITAPRDQRNIAKHPPIARPGWFSDENNRKTTPAASASVAARNFVDDAATPPCGDARRGIALYCNSFTPSMTAGFIVADGKTGGHRPPLQQPNGSLTAVFRIIDVHGLLN